MVMNTSYIAGNRIKHWMRIKLWPIRAWRATQADEMWLAVARRLPRKLVYWCLIRAGARASTGRWSSQVVPELTLIETIQRWELQDDA